MESMIPTTPQDAYRRRDLNIATVLEAGPQPGRFLERAVVYSGVFTPENGVWTVPVVVAPGGVVTMADPAAATTLRQGFQVYHSAKVGLFHRATREMHMVMFGGITVLERDAVTGTFTQDNNAPFTNQCGVVIRRADGSFKQHFLPTRFPLILTIENKELRFGTNAEFFPAPGLPMLHPKVIDLAAIDRETVIGHVFGGIMADAGNGGATGASGRVFEVVLTPTTVAPTPTIVRNGPNVTLSWTGSPAWDYLMETSTDLHQWQQPAGPIPGTAGPMEWNHPIDLPKHFFRLLGGTRSLDPPP
jgi:hypothetical protein